MVIDTDDYILGWLIGITINAWVAACEACYSTCFSRPAHWYTTHIELHMVPWTQENIVWKRWCILIVGAKSSHDPIDELLWMVFLYHTLLYIEFSWILLVIANHYSWKGCRLISASCPNHRFCTNHIEMGPRWNSKTLKLKGLPFDFSLVPQYFILYQLHKSRDVWWLSTGILAD